MYSHVLISVKSQLLLKILHYITIIVFFLFPNDKEVINPPLIPQPSPLPFSIPLSLIPSSGPSTHPSFNISSLSSLSIKLFQIHTLYGVVSVCENSFDHIFIASTIISISYDNIALTKVIADIWERLANRVHGARTWRSQSGYPNHFILDVKLKVSTAETVLIIPHYIRIFCTYT